MSIFGRIFRAGFRAHEGDAGAPPAHDDFWYMPVHADNDTAEVIDMNSAMRVSAVYACVRVIAETLATCSVKVYRRLGDDGREEARTHELWQVLRHQPNSLQTGVEFWEMLIGHVLLRGVAYAEIRGDVTGAVSELWPLHPDHVAIEQVGDNRIRYRYTPPGSASPVVYLPEELLVIRGMGQSVTCHPISPIGHFSNAIGWQKTMERYGARFFRNNARPDGYLSVEKPLKPQTRESILAAWNSRYMGPSNAHRTALLDGGMKYEALGVRNTDAQFLESRKFSASEIAAIFRVPPHMLGLLDRATFSNIEHQAMEFVRYTLRPWAKRIEEAIRRDLLLTPDTYYVEFVLDSLLRGDIMTRYQAYSIGRQNGWLSTNEVRRAENMNPIDGGDTDYLRPLNMTRTESDADPEPDDEPEPEPLDEDEDPTPVEPEPGQDGSGDANARLPDLGPVVTDAARRIRASEANAMRARSKHAAGDPDRWLQWYCQQAAPKLDGYARGVLEPIAAVVVQLFDEPVRDEAARSWCERVLTSLEPGRWSPEVGPFDKWELGREADVHRVLTETIEEARRCATVTS